VLIITQFQLFSIQELNPNLQISAYFYLSWSFICLFLKFILKFLPIKNSQLKFRGGFFMFYAGLDVGSGTAKIAVLNENKEIIFWRYEKTYGQPIETAEKLLSEIEKEFGKDSLSTLICTGTAGKTISQILGCAYINEIMAHAKSATFFHPEVKTIIDIGGEDSKLIFISHERGIPEIQDFALNTLCAAGTGSFLEQQSARLGYSIEEFSKLALKAKKVPRIAGRCTVFAKSDMIHLQQAAVPDEEIIAGLCFAIVRNLKSNLAKGKTVYPPVVFQGGVAANYGVRKAIKEVFQLKENELIIPKYFKINWSSSIWKGRKNKFSL